MGTGKWSTVKAGMSAGGYIHGQSNQPKISAGKSWMELSKSISRFNTLAQQAYDGAVLRQRLGIAGTISAKFAKATLKEVVSNAIGTFGPGAFTDVAFGDVTAGGADYAGGWSADNVYGKGFDYALGGNGGYMEAGASGMTRLGENAIKAGIGWGVGLMQGALEDAAIEKMSGESDSDRVKKYIDDNTSGHQSGAINGARQALLLGLPDLRSEDPYVNMSTRAHQAKERDGTGELIKEVVHQIDQLCYAINELDAMDKASTTWATTGGTFRKCREMVEFMGKMYWFRRKYNKTRFFMDKLKADYVAIGLVLEEMEKFWNDFVRPMELLAMRAAAKNASTITGTNGGSRVHLNVEQFGITDTKDGTYSQGPGGKGQRNWRQVKL